MSEGPSSVLIALVYAKPLDFITDFVITLVPASLIFAVIIPRVSTMEMN